MAICNSKYIAEFYQQKQYLNKYQVLHCGIKPFKPLPAKKNHTINIGFIGTVMPSKGVQTLIQAFNKLRVKNIKLDIYGPIRYQQSELKQLCNGNSNIIFHGSYKHKNVPQILSTLDIVVVPSIWPEPYGLVVQEALFANKVIIASNIGGIPEQLIDGKNGYLFPAGNSHELATKLRKIIDNLGNIKNKLDFSHNQQTLTEEVCALISLYKQYILNKK